MRYIDMQTWSRREHFKLYSSFDHPCFGMCANVDLTRFYPIIKQFGVSISVAIVYVLARAANAIPEFRQRIRDGKVVEHEVVHPSSTILTDIEDIFSFCSFEYYEDFLQFATKAEELIARIKKNPTLSDEPGKDNLLFMTAIPWVSFTSFMHPLNLNPPDSVPRFAWGKFFKDGSSLLMPLDVQVHHALMDGIHVGRFYTEVQNLFDHPKFIRLV